MVANLTLTTCWYNFKNKFTPEIYQKWISNFINYVENFNLVIYTDKNSIDIFKNFDLSDKVKIVVYEKEDWELHPLDSKLEKSYQKNKYLNRMVQKEVIMLWLQKTYFVKKTIEEKYFETEFYGWCDIGYFRDSTSKNWHSSNSLQKISKDKINYILVESNTINILKREKEKRKLSFEELRTMIPPDQVSIAGGFFIGTRQICIDWYNKFNETLNYYLDKDWLVKDDQIIILDNYLEGKFPFNLIDSGRQEWFYFIHYLG